MSTSPAGHLHGNRCQTSKGPKHTQGVVFPPFLSRTTPTCPPVQRKTVAVTPLAAVRSPASKRRVGSHFSRATTTSSVRWDLHPGADPCPGSTELTLGHRHLLLWPSLCLLKCECYGLSHQKESEEDTLESLSLISHIA